jgi:hypothetical protein
MRRMVCPPLCAVNPPAYPLHHGENPRTATHSARAKITDVCFAIQPRLVWNKAGVEQVGYVDACPRSPLGKHGRQILSRMNGSPSNSVITLPMCRPTSPVPAFGGADLECGSLPWAAGWAAEERQWREYQAFVPPDHIGVVWLDRRALPRLPALA